MTEDNMEAESSKGKKKSDYAEVEFEFGDMEFEAKGRSVVVERMFRLLLEKIEDGMKNREGKGGINVNISPGSSVPFMIVFKGLPDNLSEFIVEAVSTSLGE